MEEREQAKQKKKKKEKKKGILKSFWIPRLYEQVFHKIWAHVAYNKWLKKTV